MVDRYKEVRKIKALLDRAEYNQDDYIVGELKDNVYVQFLPALEVLHLNLENRVCVYFIKDIDLRKKFICPKCKMDLSNELKGIKPNIKTESK